MGFLKRLLGHEDQKPANRQVPTFNPPMLRERGDEFEAPHMGRLSPSVVTTLLDRICQGQTEQLRYDWTVRSMYQGMGVTNRPAIERVLNTPSVKVQFARCRPGSGDGGPSSTCKMSVADEVWIREDGDTWMAVRLKPLSKPTASEQEEIRQLLYEILVYSDIRLGDDSQQERIEKLTRYGSAAIRDISWAIYRVLRFGGNVDEVKNCGLLCEGLGRIGGALSGAYTPETYDTDPVLIIRNLAFRMQRRQHPKHFFSTAEVMPIASGILRGLGHFSQDHPLIKEAVGFIRAEYPQL